MAGVNANPVSRPRKPGWRRLVFAAVTIVLFALLGITNMLSVFRDTLQAYFGISDARFGLLLSIGAIPAAVGSLLGGVLVDRWGPSVVLRGSLVGCFVGLAAAFFAHQWVVMLAALAVLAFFVGPFGVAANTYLVRLFPNRRRRVLSLNLVCLSVGSVGFPLLAEWLLALQDREPSITFGQVLHAPFGVIAAVVLLGALLYRRRKALAPPRPEPSDTGLGGRGPLSQGAWLLITLLVIHGTCDNASFYWMPRVLGSGSYAEHVFIPGVVVAMYSLGYAVSRGVLSLLPEHWGVRVMMIVPGLLGGGIFLAGVLSRSQMWASIAYVVGAFCWSVEYPVILSVLAGNRRFGSALGIQMIAVGLATFAVTTLMGHVAEWLTEPGLWAILLIPAAGFPLVGLGGAWYVWRSARSRPA